MPFVLLNPYNYILRNYHAMLFSSQALVSTRVAENVWVSDGGEGTIYRHD